MTVKTVTLSQRDLANLIKRLPDANYYDQGDIYRQDITTLKPAPQPAEGDSKAAPYEQQVLTWKASEYGLDGHRWRQWELEIVI